MREKEKPNTLLLVIKQRKLMVMKYMFGDIKEHLVFLIVHMQQKMMEQTLTVKK